MLKFHAKLDVASEVPAKTSAGAGTLEATLDMASKTLTWALTYYTQSR